MSDPLQPNRPLPSRFLCQWDSPGKETGVGCHALLQGIFPTQGWNSCLRHCRRILYCWASGEAQVLGHTWKWSIFHFFPFRSMRGFFFDIHCLCNCTVHGILQDRLLEWVAIPFSSGSSQPRNRTGVSHIAGGFFTSRATREALFIVSTYSSSWG